MTEIALSLDCLGMKCPRPIIELNAQIGEVEIGQLVELLADDPAAASDLTAWCRMRGHELDGFSESHHDSRQVRRGALSGGAGLEPATGREPSAQKDQ